MQHLCIYYASPKIYLATYFLGLLISAEVLEGVIYISS